MAIYLSNRDGNGKTNEEGHYRLQTRIFEGFNLFQNDLKVVETSPLAMTVWVSPGDYRLETSAGYSYTGWIDTNTVVTITTADPANPRITTVVLYIDKGAATSASPPNNPGIAKVMAVNGTPAGSPTAPSGAAIQSAVGAGNPYYILANVLVGAAVTQITNSNITDLRSKLVLVDNVVDTTAIIDGSVTQAKLANTAIIDNTRLASNAVTNVKIANSTIADDKIDFTTFPYGRLVFSGGATNTGGIVVGAGGESTVTFDQLETASKGGMTKPSNGLLVVPEAGVYLVTASLAMTDVPNTLSVLQLRSDPAGGSANTNFLTPWTYMGHSATNNRGVTVATTRHFTAGTAIRLVVANTSGSAIRYNYWTGRDEANLTVTRIS